VKRSRIRQRLESIESIGFLIPAALITAPAASRPALILIYLDRKWFEAVPVLPCARGGAVP
jgi:hypothetical protein